MDSTSTATTRRRRITRAVGVAAVALIAVAGCSSSGDAKSDAARDVKRTADRETTTTTPSAPTTEAAAPSTTAAPAGPACTKEAVAGLIQGGTGSSGQPLPVTVIDVVCGGGYAGVGYSNTVVDAAAMLRAEGDQWVNLTENESVMSELCGPGNPKGLPADVYAAGCDD
jgi:hypothetical protein